MKNRSVEEIHIENLSKKRYELFGQEYPDWDVEKEATLHPPAVEAQIKDLAKQILKCIKNWRYALPFEFIIEELTKLGWAPCLLYDDDGRFAISGEGMQNINPDDGAFDCHLTHFVEKDAWKPTIREALNHYLDEE